MACALGCEGIVSKRLGSPYHSGRTDQWLKGQEPACRSCQAGARNRLGEAIERATRMLRMRAAEQGIYFRVSTISGARSLTYRPYAERAANRAGRR